MGGCVKIRTGFLIVGLLVAVLFASLAFLFINYSGIGYSTVLEDGSGSDSATPSEKVLFTRLTRTDHYCNTPYTASPTGCCLDLNNNGLCDLNEDSMKGSVSDFLDDRLVLDGCGDGICDSEESSSDCCIDCGCPVGELCTIDNECFRINKGSSSSGNEELSASDLINDSVNNTRDNITISLLLGLAPLKPVSKCGDGICNSDDDLMIGLENSSTCCVDCGCPEGTFCHEGSCTSISLVNDGLLNGVFTDDFYNNLSTTDYLVVTIDSVAPKYWFDNPDCHWVLNKEYCTSDNINELFVYVQSGFTTTDYGELQKVIYPLGRPRAVYTPEIEPAYLISPDNPLPVFAFEKDNVDNDLIINILVSEADEKEVLQKITYDDSYNDVKENFFTGRNDLLVNKTIILKKSEDFDLGEHEFLMKGVLVKYTVREVKVPYDVPVTVRLRRVSFKFSADEPEAENPSEALLWYRVADNLVADEFGVGVEYDSHQNAGGRELGLMGSLIPSYPKSKDFDNLVLYDTDSVGPFLFIEADLYDRDSSCKGLDGSPYPCADTDRLDELNFALFSIVLDNPDFLSDPADEVVFEKEQNGIIVEIVRGAYYND